jgi:hypothetical protein
MEGLKAEWKKAQKKPKNSMISDRINMKKPFFNPIFTTRVC